MLTKDDYKNDHSSGMNPKGKQMKKQRKRQYPARKSGRSIEASKQESDRKIYKTDRQTSLQFNLARSKTIKVKGQGKNALRQDVIYKTIIRALKWFYTNLIRSAQEDLDEISCLNRSDQLLSIRSSAMIIAHEIIKSRTDFLKRYDLTCDDVANFITSLAVPPSVKELQSLEVNEV